MPAVGSAASRSIPSSAAGRASASSEEWLAANEESLARADALIASQLADRQSFGEHTNMKLCDAIHDVVGRSLRTGSSSVAGGAPASSLSSESSSLLLLGEAGSGKTHAVEWCIRQLQEAEKSLVVLRARGGAYATDVECVRHLASQVAGHLVKDPRANASFEEGMEWLRQVLAKSFKTAGAVVVVLDRFEHFCSRARQTLLYNLFDIAQEVGVALSIIGMSERMDVMSMLEKRIRSRFSMRHLHSFVPTSMDGLVKVLMTSFRLASDCGLKEAFTKEFNRHVEGALRARGAQWQPHLRNGGHPPSWFLWQCLPLASLLREAVDHTGNSAPSSAPAKRARTGAGPDASSFLPSTTPEDGRALLLSSLSEAEHVLLLGFWRLKSRQLPLTLARALHEVQMLHDGGGFVAAFVQDRYCAAFESLLRVRLLELGAGSDSGKRYLPCHCPVDSIYTTLVRGLESPGSAWNPLRALPQPVQQWAARQRRG
jgi:hypothetical protein